VVSRPSTVAQLPLPISSFLGRESELNTLHQMLASGTRLITLVGPGGVGKTRLALEVCAREATNYPHGAAFVTLEAISDPEFVLPEIALALSIELRGNTAPLADLVAALADKHFLLCIDNWEHIIEAAVQIAPLLAACPDLQIIATSREALRLRGEHVLWVDPLLLPSPGSSFKPETAAEAQAVQLFVERARAARLGFELNERNAAAILEICSLLDGLPLAIELAAALMRLFSPEALLARMKASRNFAGRSGAVNLLVGGPRDMPARQQTIRSTIDWSYQLLDADEQRVFRRLAVFAGGCDLDAAVAICDTDQESARPTLDILITLVDKNLIQVREVQGEPRFSMLRTIHDFAIAVLDEQDNLTYARRKHAEYFLELGERAQPELKGHNSTFWFKRLDQEQDNLRAMLVWSQHTGNFSHAARLATSLAYYWYIRGNTQEGIRTFIELLKNVPDGLDPNLHIRLLRGAGMMAMAQGEYRVAQNHFEFVLSLARHVEDWYSAQRALGNLGFIADGLGDLVAARSYYLQALDLANQQEDSNSIATSLLNLGVVAYAQGERAEAENFFQQGLPLMEELGDPNGIAIAAGNLGRLASSTGDFDTAKPYIRRSLKISEDIGDTRLVALDLSELGRISLRERDTSTASSYFHRSLQLVQKLAEKSAILEVLRPFTEFELECGTIPRAARLWGFEKKERDIMGLVIPAIELDENERIWAKIRQNLVPEDINGLLHLGQGMNFKEAIAFALDSPALSETIPPRVESRKPPSRGNIHGLTVRELDVLRLVAQGMTDAQVAESLVISPRTVNAHLTSIYSKLGVNSRVAATRFAVDQGLAT
jgi:predicted ATPase/DNA-binding CsgD family transcriptional regulator/Tfp pilus assembly protein PilF